MPSLRATPFSALLSVRLVTAMPLHLRSTRLLKPRRRDAGKGNFRVAGECPCAAFFTAKNTSTRGTNGDENHAMKKSNQSTNHEPTHEEITALAQQIYEEEGCPCGKAEEHWHEAERRLRQQTTGDGQKAAVLVAGRREPQRESVAV